MANDRAVLREVWEGKLPVSFQLDRDEVAALRAPDPYYLMVPRVRKHFLRFTQAENADGEMWLDFNGIPLKWHYPIGVLFDLLADASCLPWALTVHFTKYPEKELLHCSNRDVVESHFMSCMKEADMLKHRSPIFSTMQRKDHTQLWLGLQNGNVNVEIVSFRRSDKFDQFWAVNRKLMEGDDSFKYIPFRWYFGDEPYSQKLIRSVNEDRHAVTLLDLIHLLLPNAETSKLSILVHGISPPFEAPLQWMSQHLSHPDNFLHIVCHSQK